MDNSVALFWMTESPLHAGTGATLSAIDLPIQREAHTGNPIVYGTGVKGALRDQKEDVAIFGPPSANASDHAGLGIFSDARVLLFPVACAGAVFVWVTCPAELHRLRRDLVAIQSGLSKSANTAVVDLMKISVPNPSGNDAAVAPDCGAIINKKIFLDDAAPLNAAANADAKLLANWFASHAFPAAVEYEYWRTLFPTNFVIVPNSEYSYLVRTRTHVEMHVKIDKEKGTVEEGPWSQESLPPDTILYSTIALEEPLAKKVRDELAGATPLSRLTAVIGANARFQMCGSQTTGKGWVSHRALS